MDFGAVGVLHQTHFLIVGEGDLRACLDAGDEARVHAVAEFGDAVGVPAEMRRPEETRELRSLRTPRGLHLLDAPAEIDPKRLDRFADEIGDFGIDAGVIEIGAVGNSWRARALLKMTRIIRGLRLET